MTTAIGEKLLSAEDYFALPGENRPTELVRGKVIEMNPPGFRHGAVCARIIHRLLQHLESCDLGVVTGNDAGVITERDPDSVRGPDVAFYSYGRVPRGSEPVGYPGVAPEVVFEVLSPEDRWAEVHRKTAEYLEAGVLVVCVVDPLRRRVHVYEPDHAGIVLAADEELTLPRVLPALRLPVQQILGEQS